MQAICADPIDPQKVFFQATPRGVAASKPLFRLVGGLPGPTLQLAGPFGAFPRYLLVKTSHQVLRRSSFLHGHSLALPGQAQL